MGLLLFKKVFAGAIRSGEKTTTLRYWDRARVKVGQRVFSPGVGYMRVTSVGEVKLAELTAADAMADGFGSVAALKTALGGMYSGEAKRKPLWRVAFVYEGEREAGLFEGRGAG